jgi:threonyl-tRNA synthetase
MLVVGRREAEEGTVAVRELKGGGQTVMPLADAIARLVADATPPDLR